MLHIIFLVLSVLASIGLIAATARTAYIAGSKVRLDEKLAKYKGRSEQELLLFKRVYSRKFVYALCFESAWAVLFAFSSLLDVVNGQPTVLSTAMTGLGLVCGVTGSYMISRTLKTK